MKNNLAEIEQMPKLFREYKIQDVDLIENFAQNSRTHSEEQIQEVVKSIDEFGFTNPLLVDENNILIAGHCRLEAAKRIGLKQIPTVIINDLTEVQKAALVIADNKMALNAGWDFTKLSEQITFLQDNDFDIALTGFHADELTFMPQEVPAFIGDEDDVPEAPVEPITKRGNVWLLGEHRLMCGDSTMIDDVEKLMNGQKAQICFTSPPYNLGDNAKMRGNNASGKDSAYNERSDHKTQQEYLDFLYSFTNNVLLVSDIAFINIQCLAGNKLIFPEYLHQYKDNIVDIMVWDKEYGAPAMPKKVLNSAFEFIIIISASKNPNRTIFTAPDFRGTISNIYRLNPQGKKEEIQKDHGAVFPVKFAEDHIKQFSTGNVYEPFGGTGTTVIASEKLNRKCYMMELSPNYCDVIIKRYEQFTGKKAELEKNNVT